MIMIGMICWGYHVLIFTTGYPSDLNNNVFNVLINTPWIFTVGMGLLILSVPFTLFCLFNKPQKIDEIDKSLEDQDDLD